MHSRINIFDVGARYGVHHTWQDLFDKRLCNYYAFEPDIKEYKRLTNKYENEDLYHIVNMAMGKERNNKHSLYIYKHHGNSSLLNINENSDWFKRHASAGEVESAQNIKMETIDNYSKNNNIRCVFLKTDTEGYDLSVIEGSLNQLKNIIGIQCEAYFQETYINAGMFNDVFSFLTNNGFILLNFDYDGRGLSRNYFCVGNKYGTITELDAVFVKPLEMIKKNELLIYAIFCFNNHASDLALDALFEARNCGILNVDKQVPILEYLANEFILIAKELEHAPYNIFEQAVRDYEYIFQRDYPRYHRYYSD